MRQFLAILLVVIFVVGTATTAFIASAPVSTPTTATGTETPSAANQLITQADQAAATNDWETAVGLYRAALGLTPGNATVHYKLGKALLSQPNPDYAQGVSNLQQAISLNPSASFAAEAQTLIDQNKDKAASQTPAGGVVTGTTTITGSTTTTDTGGTTSTGITDTQSVTATGTLTE